MPNSHSTYACEMRQSAKRDYHCRQCPLIPHMRVRCDGRNCANPTTPPFSFCRICSHVRSKMASSPLMGCVFWCEPISISMYTYGSHPVRNANLGSARVLHQRINTSYGSYSRPWGDRTPQLLVSAVFEYFLRAQEVTTLYNASFCSSFLTCASRTSP